MALPAHWISQERACSLAQGGLNEKRSRVLTTIYRRSTIKSRHSVLLDRDDGATSFYDLADSDSANGPGTEQRMQRYAADAIPLAVSASRHALTNAGYDAGEITHLITVSCTGFVSPGLDREIIESLRLPRSVSRTNIGFMGCHAALNAMQVALAIANAPNDAAILLCATELCSLHFQSGGDADNVLPNALFADGSAALTGKPARGNQPWTCRATGSYLVPDSHTDMTWRIGDHGFRMTLSRRVPALIAENLKSWLQQWLTAQGLSIAQIGSWAVHPGGPGILEAVSTALGLPGEALDVSRSVLADYGNMSSPTILFIVDRLRRMSAPLPCVMLAFGPGLAIEAALLV